MQETKKPRKNKYPAEGVTLEKMVTKLVKVYGWDPRDDSDPLAVTKQFPKLNSGKYEA